MAYQNYSNNRDNNKYEPEVSSAYRMNNAESNVDKTALLFGYWNNMLKITIAPKKEDSDEIRFEKDKGITVYLNHHKARIFAEEVKNFLRDPITYNGSGIPTGSSVITISNGSDVGANTPVLIIRKMDDIGNVTSTFVYEFKTDYYFSVRGYNGGREFSRETNSYNNIEILELITVLENYYNAMTYAGAYTVKKTMISSNDFMISKIDAIAEKLGVEVNRTSNRGSSFSSTTFFNSANASNSNISYAPTSIDDID